LLTWATYTAGHYRDAPSLSIELAELSVIQTVRSL
jgi:hypothetical protein